MTDYALRTEALITADKWQQARKVIELALRHDPENHWFIARLALTFYEQHDYQQALDLSGRALSLFPHCPLALWEQAGALSMLGRKHEAIKIWKSLLRRGIENIAYGECGEGRDRKSVV